MFRKQGIDISSRGSFELPARLRIIVRVLSRNGIPTCPTLPRPAVFLLLRARSSAPWTSRPAPTSLPAPRPSLGYRSIYPVGPLSLYFARSSKMQPEGCVLRTDFSLAYFPRDYSLQSIPTSAPFYSRCRFDQFDDVIFPSSLDTRLQLIREKITLQYY